MRSAMKLSLALLLSHHCVIVQASHQSLEVTARAAANETALATWEACIRDPWLATTPQRRQHGANRTACKAVMS